MLEEGVLLRVESKEILGDLHVHTHYSDGLDDPRSVVEAAKRAGLRILAVTDHDTVRGALEAIKYGGLEIVIVPGVEVSSRDGHIICLGVTEEPQLRGAKAEEVVEWCRERGGVSIYAHPFGYLLRAPILSTRRIVEVAKIVDAIEVVNGRTIPKFNERARELAISLSKPMTAGSDAHTASRVGSVKCLFLTPVDTVDDVLRAVRNGFVKPLGPMPSFFQVVSSIIGKRFEVALRKLGIRKG